MLLCAALLLPAAGLAAAAAFLAAAAALAERHADLLDETDHDAPYA